MLADLLPRQNMRITYETSNVLVGEIINERTWYSLAQEGALVVAASSVYDMLEYTLEHYPRPRRDEASSKPKSRYEGNFYHFNSFEDAVHTFKTDPKSIRNFEIHDAPLKALSNVGNDVIYDVVGDYIDIGRVIEGVPESCGNFVMGNPRNLFVNIVINVSSPASVSNTVINYRSSRVLRLVDWLETQQIRTAISALEVTQCGVSYVVCKDYHDPVDLNTLAVVTNPDWLRRIVFRQNEYSSTWQWGYGTPVSTSDWKFMTESDDTALNISVDWFHSVEQCEAAFETFEQKIEEYVTEGFFADAY